MTQLRSWGGHANHDRMVEWCAIIYDKPGVDRSVHRQEHLAEIPKLVEQGKLVQAGAIYKEVVDGRPSQFAGSQLTLVADSREEALAIIRDDPFAKHGVWDVENVVLYPFGCAVRKEKQ